MESLSTNEKPLPAIKLAIGATQSVLAAFDITIWRQIGAKLLTVGITIIGFAKTASIIVSLVTIWDTF